MRKKRHLDFYYVTTTVLAIGTLACSSSQPPAATPPVAPVVEPEIEPRDVRPEPAEATPAEPAASTVTSVMDGVYTSEQSARGEALYRKACQSCHTPTLRGGVVIPALVGTDFIAKWARMSTGDLYERIRTTMPPSASRRLTREEYADVVAFMFDKNNFPAGEQELGSEFAELKNIQIQSQ